MHQAADYHPEARAELLEQGRFYRRHDQDVARAFLVAVRAANWQVAEAPHRFPRHLFGTQRLLLPRRWPIGLVYIQRQDDVPLIIAVEHQKRLPGYWQHRLARG